MNLLAYYHYGSSPLLLILLILLLIGALPIYPYNRSWGYSPVALLLIVVVLFALVGCSFVEGVRQSDTNVKTTVSTKFGKFTYDSKSTVNQGP